MTITQQPTRGDAPSTRRSAGSRFARLPRGRQGVLVLVVGLVVAGTVVAVLVASGALRAVGGAGGAQASQAGSDPRPAPDFTTPDQVVGGVPVPEDKDSTQSREWKAQVKAAVGNARVVARTYSTSATSPTTEVVVAAADLAGKLELAWAADAGTAVGDDRCTQNLRFSPGTPAEIQQTVSLCWRTTATLSAYVLVIDPRHPVRVDAGATALDAAWKQSLA